MKDRKRSIYGYIEPHGPTTHRDKDENLVDLLDDLIEEIGSKINYYGNLSWNYEKVIPYGSKNKKIVGLQDLDNYRGIGGTDFKELRSEAVKYNEFFVTLKNSLKSGSLNVLGSLRKLLKNKKFIMTQKEKNMIIDNLLNLTDQCIINEKLLNSEIPEPSNYWIPIKFRIENILNILSKIETTDEPSIEIENTTNKKEKSLEDRQEPEPDEPEPDEPEPDEPLDMNNEAIQSIFDSFKNIGEITKK